MIGFDIRRRIQATGAGCRSGSASTSFSPSARQPPSGVDGHQTLSPINSTAAGTMIVRTTKVSSRMPTATMKPRSNANVTGSVISTEKVPARISPALVITGPVITSAGVILAGTFSVLMTLPVTYTFDLGFMVALGILLDTFIVRTIMVPAAVELIGDKIWWPSTASGGTRLFHDRTEGEEALAVE